MFKRFVNFVAVILLFVGFDAHGALEKIRDSEYMRTAYQWNSTEETIESETYNIYTGEFSSGDRAGFDAWEKDVKYLCNTITKSTSNAELVESRDYFKILTKITFATGLFELYWSLPLRLAALDTLECMLSTRVELNDASDNCEFADGIYGDIRSIITVFAQNVRASEQ